MSDEEFTVFCRNLSEDVTEPLLYELFLQAGPVEDVRIPTQDGKNRSYGFIVFKHKCSVRYAIDLFKDTQLFGKYIALQNRALDAEREAEMRNRWRNRNGDFNLDSLRGGPSPNRYNDMNALRGGMPSNFSRDDMNPLRGGMGFSRMDSMAPRSFSDNPYRQSPKSESFDARLMNPYGSSMGSFAPDSRGSRFDNDLQNYMRRNDDKNDRRDRRDYDNRHRNEGYDRHDRRRDERSDRHHGRDRNRDYDRHRRRSRSRDRSPNYDRSRRR